MDIRFAAAIIEQGRFAPTDVGDFTFIPEFNAHIWKGKTATTAAELAEQVTGAVQSIVAIGDPFTTFRIIQIGEKAAAPDDDENVATPESVNAALIQANGELNEVIATISPHPRSTLTIIPEPERVLS